MWRDEANRRFTSFVISQQQLLATGHPEKTPEQIFLALINAADGSTAWSHSLPAEAVKGGTAIDRQGRIYVALENGKLLCFAGRDVETGRE